MNTKKFLLINAALILCASLAFSQKVYEYNPNTDEYSIKVKTGKGERPSIIHFVNTILNEPEDEFFGSLSDMWNKYLKKSAQEDGNILVVDKANGYVLFEDRQKGYDDDEIFSQTEICYWNCSDGKHKLVAISNNLFINKKAINGQYTGAIFYLYDNATKMLGGSMANYDVGAIVDVECDDEKNSGEEYVIVMRLPRVGKNIKVYTYVGDKIIKRQQLVWNGLKFKLSPLNE